MIQETLSPVDGQIYVTRELADANCIQGALTQAVAAQGAWQRLPLSEKLSICQHAVALLSANKAALGEEICWMMGRPIRYASKEIDGLAERATHMMSLAEEALSDIVLPHKSGVERMIKKVPLGVSLVIAPWNYPYLTAINALVPALLSGNCVLLKHSAQTPLCSERLVAAFQEAGLPKGVLQYLHMSHRDTLALINEVDHVAFTGSVSAGAQVEQAAVGRFIPVGLELGGKDAAYICEDADIAQAVASVIDGAYFNSGQSCCGIERIYVHASRFDDVVEAAVAQVRKYTLGRPDEQATTLGPMVRAGAADWVRAHIQDALSKGAQAHIDEREFAASEVGSPYLAPQLLTEVDHSMRVMSEESFGPVVGICAVESDEMAVRMINDSQFGLTSAIYSRDCDRAQALGAQIETGTVFVNRCDYLDPGLAWTGVKQSGRGCTLSRLGFDAVTRPKSFHIQQV